MVERRICLGPRKIEKVKEDTEKVIEIEELQIMNKIKGKHTW